MNTETEYFGTMDSHQLMEINGGGFAYDVGRVIRFLGVSALCANPITITNAIMDWVVTDIINETANNQQ